MTTLKEFIDKIKAPADQGAEADKAQIGRDNDHLPTFNTVDISSAVLSVFSAAGLVGIEKSKQESLSNHIAEVVSSDEFMSDLSNKLGEPKPGETENEFVARARMAFRGIISRKLKTK